MTRLASFVVLSIAAALSAAAALAAPRASDRPAGADDLLLEGLDDLLGGAEAKPAAPPRDAGRSVDAPGWLPNRKELDRLMKESLDGKTPMDGLGEDLGESPLVTLRSTMDRAGRLIATGDDGAQTRPTQEQAVAQLDELIKKMEKQCQSCQSCSGGECNKKQQTRRSKPSQSPAKQAKQGKKPGSPKGESAAKQSTARLGQAEAAEAAAARRAEVVKRVWGSLPERLREQMLQSTTDEFLPEYRQEIEQYFERLAEEPSDDR